MMTQKRAQTVLEYIILSLFISFAILAFIGKMWSNKDKKGALVTYFNKASQAITNSQ